LEKSLKQRFSYTLAALVLIALLPFFGINALGQIRLGMGSGSGAAADNDKIALSYANPREFEIADIEVTGLETIDKNALISFRA
jgi:hypothetical protein